MVYLLFLVFVVATALLVFVVRIAADVRTMRNELLPDIRSALLQDKSYQYLGAGPRYSRLVHNGDPTHFLVGGGLGCFVIWEWCDGDWFVREAPAGVEPGLPPNYPGGLQGEKATCWIPAKR